MSTIITITQSIGDSPEKGYLAQVEVDGTVVASHYRANATPKRVKRAADKAITAALHAHRVLKAAGVDSKVYSEATAVTRIR